MPQRRTGALRALPLPFPLLYPTHHPPSLSRRQRDGDTVKPTDHARSEAPHVGLRGVAQKLRDGGRLRRQLRSRRPLGQVAHTRRDVRAGQYQRGHACGGGGAQVQAIKPALDERHVWKGQPRAKTGVGGSVGGRAAWHVVRWVERHVEHGVERHVEHG
eukprot:356798-Chlamydomonas_euryale.AAC.5